MRILVSIAAGLEVIVHRVGSLAGWLILPLTGIIIADVVLRRWFVIGSTGLQEMEWHLHGALFLLCLGQAYLRNAHVRIELVHERLGARRRAWLEWAGCLLFLLPYCAAIVWFGMEFAGRSFALSEASASQTGLGARWVIKSVLVMGFVLLGMAGLSRFMRLTAYLFTGHDLDGTDRHLAELLDDRFRAEDQRT